MHSMLALFLALVAPAAATLSGTAMSAMVEPSTGTLRLVPRRSSAASFESAKEAAWAHYKDSAYASTGWARLEVHTNPAVADSIAALAAGMLEGNLTASRIYEAAMNSGVGPLWAMNANTSAFVKANDEWIASMQKLAAHSTAADRAYWHQVSLIYIQLQGIHQGYSAAAAASGGTLPPLSFLSLLALNMGDELGAFSGFVPGGEAAVARGSLPVFGDLRPFFDAGKCSALVKLLDGGADLLIAQETWGSLESMLRIYKLYDFPYTLTGEPGSARVPASRSSFPSYPAALASGDDFYVLSTGLVVQETTIGNSNPDLVTAFVSPLTLMEWTRNVLANRLAATGLDWPGIYGKHNSGSYNNQNMILDYNLFVPGRPLVAGTLLLAEQVPGHLATTDLSDFVQKRGYFGSYNSAFDPYIRTVSGADAAVAKGGPWFDYWETARAQIFARDQPGIAGVAGMQAVMRSCDYLHDPLSRQQCPGGYINDTTTYHPLSTTENCIATRGDLNPASGNYCLFPFGHRDHVATDAKISSFSTFDVTTLPATVVAGPTWGAQSGKGELPPFCWSSSDYNATLTHLGHPDCFRFDWVTQAWPTSPESR